MGKSELLTEELRTQLKLIFSKLNKRVKLILILDQGEKSKELESLVEDFTELSPLLEVEKQESLPEVDTLHLPCVALFTDENKYSGVCFHGVPGGKEINSFVAAIAFCGGAGQMPDKFVTKSINAIKEKTHIRIFVSLACHHCPHVVAACNKIAMLNENVEAHMYDANLYPDLVEKYNIQRVPMMVVNEKDVIYGKKEIAEIANLLNMTKK